MLKESKHIFRLVLDTKQKNLQLEFFFFINIFLLEW